MRVLVCFQRFRRRNASKKPPKSSKNQCLSEEVLQHSSLRCSLLRVSLQDIFKWGPSIGLGEMGFAKPVKVGGGNLGAYSVA